MPANALRQGIHDQTCADALGKEEIGRSDSVVDQVNDAALPAQLTYARKVYHLCARIRNGLNEYDARPRSHRRCNVRDIRRIYEADAHTDLSKRLEQAVRIAEQETAGHEVIARAQQREQRRSYSAHACAEHDTLHPFLHGGDLLFESRCRGLRTAGVRVSRTLALEDSRQVARVSVAIRNGSANPPQLRAKSWSKEVHSHAIS